MKLTESIMGMPVAIEVLDPISGEFIDNILAYFHQIDTLFSPYKKLSEISRINSKSVHYDELSPIVRRVLKLCEDTKKATGGYFDIEVEGHIDPSGLVKGFAIWEASQRLTKSGFKNFYIEIGGDIEICGNKNGQKWKVGIPHPFKNNKQFAVLRVSDCGIATSGYISNGLQIYNPLKKKIINDIATLTVIGPNIYEADRYSTASFAMGAGRGLEFLENLEGFEAILFTKEGKEFTTSNIAKYLEA